MSVLSFSFFFFFTQKTAYEMRISDWSSDVCSSDLLVHPLARGGIDGLARRGVDHAGMAAVEQAEEMDRVGQIAHGGGAARQRPRPDVRMGAGAGAGDQRIEQVGNTARLRSGLGR